MEAIKILSGNRQAISRDLTVFEMWENRLRQVDLRKLRDATDCPACKRGEFDWLSGRRGDQSAVLCGRNAVQLSRMGAEAISLDALAEKLAAVGRVSRNAYLLRLAVDEYKITVFPDGRAIVQGTDDIAEAKTIHAKYIGN
jgi:adenylyltransferase/sulfurtransferase